ncbi:MAG TPA: PKD domain-containing protein, partial [Anaeromyxobacter sp.]|nr:PKD domain-containing protein [Anaeromyxobacter sp.]
MKRNEAALLDSTEQGGITHMTHVPGIHLRLAVLAGALALAEPALAQEAAVGSEGTPADPNVVQLAVQSAAVANGVNIVPLTYQSPIVGNCIPFGDNVSYGFTGFIYRNIPPFELRPGDKIRFDLGSVNGVDVRRTIFFARANVNPARYTYPTGQGVRADGGWTQVVSETQTPANPRGNFEVGDFELTYTAEASFSFPGGGLIVGFQGAPPATYFDGGCDQVLSRTVYDDASNLFYTRFFWKADRTLDPLDLDPGGVIWTELGGMIIESSNRPPAVAADNASVAVSEGDLATNTGTFSDPDVADDVTVTASVGTVTRSGTNGGTWSWSLQTTDGPVAPQVVTITADDGHGEPASTTFTYSVANVAPAITTLQPGPAASCGGASALAIAFFDPALANDAYTATVDWGDGSAAETFAAAGFELTAAHAYAMAGLYTVTVTVADEDGGASAPASAVAALNLTVVGGGVLQPVNPDGTSVFRYGSTIPVKAKFADCDGSLPG